MFRFVSFVFVFLLMFQSSAAVLEASAQPSHAQTAEAIRAHYESRLHELKPVYRGHWSLRLYRLSGDSGYLEPLRAYGDYLFENFARLVRGLNDPELKARERAVLLGAPEKPRTEKYRKRRDVLAGAGDYVYMHQLLYLTFIVQSIGLDQRDAAMYQTSLTALKNFPFKTYLAERDLLLYNAAEMSNAVYYLKTLGLGHFDRDYERRFQRIHQATDDSGDLVLLENKVYGLTHLVIAASEYYQKRVSGRKFRRILNYFDQNADRLLAQLKPDIAAEVGLCFLLADKPGHPVVQKTRDFIVRAWDPASGMIPSVSGSTDLNNGEHRNVLAFMLLKGLERLYPGPDLGG